jgi:hypothetical protein
MKRGLRFYNDPDPVRETPIPVRAHQAVGAWRSLPWWRRAWELVKG